MSQDQSNVINPPAQNATTTPPSGGTISPTRYREAFQKIAPELAALDPAKLLPVNVDVTSSFTTVLGALPRIAALRDRASQITEVNIKYIDNLETYALALMHAQGEYVSASAPPEAIVALNEEGSAMRDNLYSDALALANRGLINGDPLKELKAGPGYKNLGEDLLGLSSLIRKSWDAIGSRTVITMEELDRAEDVSDRLLRAVAVRENASSALDDAVQQRLRAFTLFVNAYDEARRAIAYLRWHEGDLEDIAPSLYAGRGRKKTEPDPPAPVPTPAPTPPVVTATPTVGAEPTHVPAAASSTGVPQNNPFANKLS